MPDLLIVCTANRCRSPIAAALLQQRLPTGSGVRVRSAGLLPGGERMPQEGLDSIRRFGIDLSPHCSEQVSPASLRSADLILTMTSKQARELIGGDTSLVSRCMTLKYFVRHASAAIAHRQLHDLTELVATLVAERNPEDLLRTGRGYDVPDPMGRSGRVWGAVVTELAQLTADLAPLLAAGAVPSRPAPRPR